ncbi:MAG: asparaginase domain-containing protein [Xanthomonadales bacterium]|nr:asparaginase domain-containing protein [Xanthomonadales bacterium]
MKIRVLTTGGTIDKIYFDAKSDFEVGEPVIGHVLDQAKAAFAYEITEIMKKDSLELTDDDRAAIREAVEGCAERHILITHGTDTMADTGKVLMGIPEKTIVLTGALNPARFQSSDAIFNIGSAIAAVQTMPPGVYIAMNGRVFPADKVRKNRDANRFESA